jgi:predicted transcriptional regulator
MSESYSLTMIPYQIVITSYKIINTLKPEFFPENIREILRARKEAEAEKNQKFVSITAEMHDLIMNSERIIRSKLVFITNQNT